MPPPSFSRALARLLATAVLALAGLGSARAAPAPDADWRAWNLALMQQLYSDPDALAAQARQRYSAALAGGDLRARVRAAVEQAVASVVVAGAPDPALDQRVVDTLQAVRASGRRDLLFDILGARIWGLVVRMRLAEAEPLSAEQEQLARDLGDRARLATVLADRATAASLAGDLPGAQRLNQAALDAAVDDMHRGDILLSMADSTEWVLDDPQSRERRIEWARHSLELIDPDRYPHFGIHAYHVIAKHLERQDPAKALAPRRRALALAQRLKTPGTVASMQVALAEVLVRLGQTPEAIALATEALPALGSDDFRRSAFGSLAQAHALRGDAGQALAWLGRAERLVLGPLRDWPRAQEDNAQLRAAVYAQLGMWREAYVALEQARSLAEQATRTAAVQQALALEARYDSRLKDQENALLKARGAAMEERRNLLAAGLALALAAAAGLGMLAVRQVRQRRTLQVLSDEVAHHNRALQDMHASRTRLLAAACHDLRQPAHALGLLAELAAGAESPGEREEKLEGIRRCSRSLTDMLGMLMDLTRLEGGNYAPQKAPVSLDDLMHDAGLQFTALAAQKGLQLDVEACGLWVDSDRHLLRRILFNLVSNAVRYTRAGRVTVRARPAATGSVVLEVQDTGPGIPAERLPDIFAEFVRLDSKVEEGLGIGLPIVQRAATLLSHALHVHSEVGVGSCFGIELPLADPGSLTQPSHGEPAATRSNQVVLLLDDDSESLAATAGLVRQWGFDVLVATDAAQAEALAARAGRPPDLLITDLHIDADMDGLQAVEYLRRQWPGLRALLVTGDLDAQVVSRAAALGVPVGYKPLSPGRLQARVRDALAQPPGPLQPQDSAGMPLR